MIAISDIPIHLKNPNNFHNGVNRRRAELQYYIREKPTRKVKRIKRFLDVNLRDPDQDAKLLDRELSSLYNRYEDEQKMRFVSV